jgi:membrane-bound lytic murein transglycosylase D
MQLRTALPAALLSGLLLGLASAGLKSNGAASPASQTTRSAGESFGPAPAPGTTWDIPITRNEPVERFVRLFGEKQTDRMALYLKRSGQYEGMIRSKLRERGMPEDLLYLSMIESGFNPTARSPASAVGLWQFIPDTGRRYGLRIDGYVDERRDPEKSTDAALRYLQDLYDRFGSWYLAAAAYNTGENRVGRIMREVTGSERGIEDDFWRIRDRLPRETREYVPLIVAAALVGKEPHKYGLENVERRMPLPAESVTVPGGVDLGVVASAVGVTERDLHQMNPQLLRGMTPPGREYAVRIPEGRGALFASNFDTAREEARVLARERAEQARLARAQRPAQARRPAPSSAKRPAQTPSGSNARRPAQPSRPAAARATHTVRKGESLSVIAHRHGTSVAALQRANGMGRSTQLRAGQRLRVPSR